MREVADGSHAYGVLRYFSGFDRSRTVFMVVLLAIAGVLEGVGFAAFFPLLEQMTSSGGGAGSAISDSVDQLFGVVGLEPSINGLLALLVLAFWLKGAFIIYAMIQVGILTAAVTRDLRLRVLRAAVHAEWRTIASYPTGFIANAISREAQTTASTYRQFCTLVSEVMQVVAYLGLALLISWQIATAALVAGFGVMLVLRGHLGAVAQSGLDQTTLLRSISARIADSLPSLKPLKAMGKESYLLPYFEEETKAFFEASKRAAVATEVLNRGREPLVVLVLAIGLWGLLSFSSIAPTALMMMALLFYRTVTTLTNVQVRWSTVRLGESAFSSIMEHIDVLEAAKEERGQLLGPARTLESGLQLKGLSFSFDDHQILDEVTNELQAGSFVALVGPSGSGKTTLTDLIIGLLLPAEGQVSLDGDVLDAEAMSGWRRSIGYVPQDSMLFSDTIRRNVTLGEASVNDEDVVAALRDADAYDFVHRLPGGLDHRIGESGTSLSGGQKQRLAIARALVTAPTLLVLDEPTTALDSVAEQEVCNAIARLKGRLTIVAVSHQPAIREMADRVWELADGKIRELDA